MILVTGATGLVGSHLVLHLLEQKQAVKAMYRDELGKEKVKRVFEHYQKGHLFQAVCWVVSDIMDLTSLEIAFQEVDYVYHCAALISFDPKDEKKLRKINIEGTANIVNCCLEYKIKKLCYVSSIAALGDLNPNETIVTEESEWNPEKQHSDYGISKYGAELEVWRGQQEGLDVVVVNPGVILGPLFWTEGSGAIYQQIQKGLFFYTKGRTGLVAVLDVVQIIFQLMNGDIKGEKFILVAENKTYQNLTFLLSTTLQVKPPRFYAGPILTGLAWRMDWFLSTFFGKKRVISKDMSASLHEDNFYANDKIKKQLQYNFKSIDSFVKEL
jgi:dihydroflavonol-4-reductase